MDEDRVPEDSLGGNRMDDRLEDRPVKETVGGNRAGNKNMEGVFDDLPDTRLDKQAAAEDARLERGIVDEDRVPEDRLGGNRLDDRLEDRVVRETEGGNRAGDESLEGVFDDLPDTRLDKQAAAEDAGGDMEQMSEVSLS